VTGEARVASDTGGTFTDLVTDDGRITKVPSTRHDPGEAVRAGLTDLLGAAVPAVLAHGTTVATNALLERTGATVALLTTAGFADLIEIARQDRPSLYDQSVVRPEPLVPRALRLEVVERLDAVVDEAAAEQVGEEDNESEIAAGPISIAVDLSDVPDDASAAAPAAS